MSVHRSPRRISPGKAEIRDASLSMGFRSRKLSCAATHAPPLEQEHARIMQLRSETRIGRATDQGYRSTGETLSEQYGLLVVCSSEEDSAKTDEASIKSATISRNEAELMRLIKSHFGLTTILSS
jgi:hypothetical protein